MGHVYKCFLRICLTLNPRFYEFQKYIDLFLWVSLSGSTSLKLVKNKVNFVVNFIFNLHIFEILFSKTLGYFKLWKWVRTVLFTHEDLREGAVDLHGWIKFSISKLTSNYARRHYTTNVRRRLNDQMCRLKFSLKIFSET